ncbi:MAG: restriction endonuclease [Candidatus Helarchaeota archaeon]
MDCVNFEQLQTTDLIIDMVYKGGVRGNVSDDPLSILMGCGNQGGFRFTGSINNPKLVVLYSDGNQPDWPDEIDYETGIFVYYGDNRTPGDLHAKKGNKILRKIFNDLHLGNRNEIPPIFVFYKGPEGRDVVFKGLAVPGANGVNQNEDLVAIWKTAVIEGESQRFQNYKSTFTILDIGNIRNTWLTDISNNNPQSMSAPEKWIVWRNGGEYNNLSAPRTMRIRSREEQLPSGGIELNILNTIIEYFERHPRNGYAFEACASELFKMSDNNVLECDLTRPWRDGGRDAIGKYKIGNFGDSIEVDFALEAKRYNINNSIGVRQTSRLISRIRHRQFGVLVTTSHLNRQAYKEIIEDDHPILIISGIDIVRILINAGINTIGYVSSWLSESFPYE